MTLHRLPYRGATRNAVRYPESLTPLSINNLTLWLDAADTSTITTGATFTWADKSGNGYDATQDQASEMPTTGTRTINGRNVLDFDGAGDNLELNYSGLASISSGDNTVIIVWETDAAFTEQRVFSGFVSGGTRWGVQYRLGGVERVLGINNTAFTPTNHTITEDTNAHIDFMRRTITNVEAGRDGSSTTAANGVDVTVDSNIRIGATLGATSSVNGGISEILVYSKSLSDVEFNQLGYYLGSKWGATWTAL